MTDSNTDAIDQIVARGRAAWQLRDPAMAAVELDDAEVAAAIATTTVSADELDAAEIVIACACAGRDATAIAAFQATYFAPLTARLASMGLDAARRDDVWQALAERLFVSAAGAPPRIVGYAGRGQLHGLVKVAATRLALDVLERERRDSSDDWLARVPGAASDPELHWIRHQHRAELKQEIERAISELPDRDRVLLRLSLVERLGIDAIATAFRTHRATAARWIVAARTSLAELVRARLVERWRISIDELSKLDVVVDSQLDLSLERVLSVPVQEHQ